jgi:ATP-dependent Clp protease ATP-binding subunit ClpC
MKQEFMRNNYSKKLIAVIEHSRKEAARLRNRYVLPEHLMLGVICDGECQAFKLLGALDVDTKALKEIIESKLRNSSEEAVPFNEIVIGKPAERILRMSILESRLLRSQHTGTEHLFLVLLKEETNGVAQLLKNNEITYVMLCDKILNTKEIVDATKANEIRAGFTDEEEDDEENDAMFRKGSSPSSGATGTSATKVKSANDTPVLDNFGTDLTLAASEGRLDPIVGREKEIQRLAQILSRRRKNNPVLIGEPGVGKSAIVEGLAQRIVERKISRALFEKRVINLDIGSIVAGTKYRGQFEERIKAVLNELSKNPNIILFVDEIHTLVGAGAASGSMDAANMLKPALARGDLQCIGATTLDEYRKSIESDGALERRFQKVIVDPTTEDETLQIMRNIKGRYEEHHNMIYTEAALKACVKLTGRYITDRNFPDKAIDALDEAGARVHIMNIVVPPHIEELEARIEDIRNQKLSAAHAQNFELAADYRDKERIYLTELEDAKNAWEKEMQAHREVVDADQVAEVVAMMSGIPVQRMVQEENIRLREMAGVLREKIIGQDDAVDKIVKAIQRNRVGLKDPNKPVGTFMFLGPTGVGKTHLAKKIAETLFDSAEALIRIDMSEYMEKFAVSRLIGAPPGYVGYEEGGQLTEKVRRKPYSVVLLDEIEKAHPDVFNLLLQVLDEGLLTDSLGRRIDFKNTILIMTSNIGTRQLKDFGRGVGFHLSIDGETDKDLSRNVIRKALERKFAPEFLNRIDDTVMFDPLDRNAIHRIIDLELKELYKRVEEMGYHLEILPEAKEYIASKGYDVQFGARPLKRAIQKYIEDEMAEIILREALGEGSNIRIGYSREHDKMTTEVPVIAGVALFPKKENLLCESN